MGAVFIRFVTFINDLVYSVVYNQSFIKAIKTIQEKKPAVKFWYDLLNYIFITIRAEVTLTTMYSHGFIIIINIFLLLKQIISSWENRTRFSFKYQCKNLILYLIKNPNKAQN